MRRWKPPDTGAGSGGGGGAGSADVNYDAALDLDTGPINEKLAGIFDVFKAAWDNQGEKVIASMKSAFASVKALAGSIGDSFYEVFTNGTGQQTLESILSIFGNIMGCVDNLAERLKVAWDDNGNGTAIIQAWWNGLNDILGMFDRMVRSHSGVAQRIGLISCAGIFCTVYLRGRIFDWADHRGLSRCL